MTIFSSPLSCNKERVVGREDMQNAAKAFLLGYSREADSNLEFGGLKDIIH